MNFDEWYKLVYPGETINSVHYFDRKVVWAACLDNNSILNRKDAFEHGFNVCKMRVLNILNENIFKIHDTQLKHDVEPAINIEVLKEIEKL